MSPTPSLLTLLNSLPAFESFDAPQIQALAELLQPQDHAIGHALITQGEQGDGLYLLMRGMVQERKCAPGQVDAEVVVEQGVGEWFGWSSLVEGLPAHASHVAVTPVSVARLSPEAYRQLFAQALPLARHLQYMTAVRLARALDGENQRQRERLLAAER
jgi:CRP-like cAMP-binding protein